MKVIRDTLHGYIEVDELALALIDTVEMQRLRRIRQLGFAYLVYPGANHTRFEHALGVYHLMSLLLRRLGVPDDERGELLAAALIHDVRHGPYSHVTEPLIKKYTGRGHEDVEDIVFGRYEHEFTGSEPRICEVLEDYGLDRKKILEYVRGGDVELSELLSGEIDVDKMDYLLRDSYYTGVAYGVIDDIRLIQGLELHDGRLVLNEKGVIPAEYLLFSRFLMYPTVYFHHTSRIAQLMFVRGLESMIRDGEMDAASLVSMDDYEACVRMRRAGGYPQEMIRRIESRRLFKRAVYVPLHRLEEGVLRELSDEERAKRVEEEIAGAAGVAPEYVLLDVQKGEEMRGRRAMVLTGGEVRSLSEISTIVRMLERALMESRRLGVYTPEEYRERVRRAAERVLGLDRDRAAPRSTPS
ncbi:MAG: HD domain-containing protein [Candidatus Alkanophagales archaeon]